MEVLVDEPGIVLVLGAGGARGPALAGVLRRMLAERIPISGIIGCSVGAVVGAMYAGVGMDPEEMIGHGRRLDPASLLNFALSRWRVPLVSRRALRRSGGVPDHLRRLERASFARLHHGVRRLGVLVFDLLRRSEILIQGGPGDDAPLPLATAVKASAAIPLLFPPVRARLYGRRCLLVDPGWHTAVPVEHAFARPFGARRVIAVDLRLRFCPRQARMAYWEDLREACGESLVVLRPRVQGTGMIVPRRGDADRLVAAGEACLDGEALRTIRRWSDGPAIGLARNPRPEGGFLDTPGDGC